MMESSKVTGSGLASSGLEKFGLLEVFLYTLAFSDDLARTRLLPHSLPGASQVRSTGGPPGAAEATFQVDQTGLWSAARQNRLRAGSASWGEASWIAPAQRLGCCKPN